MSASTRRMIPPLVDDPRVVHLSLAQRYTLALLPLALDDHGRALDDCGRMNGLLWGSLWRDHGPDALDADLSSLADAGLITRYELDGVRYLQMLDWDAQQVISRRGPSRYPAPPTGTRSTGTAAGAAAGGAAGAAAGGRTWPKGPGEAVWDSIDGLVDYMAGAAERLSDPSVQTKAVSFLADLAGQFDPAFADRVREQAGSWMGSVAYGAPKAWKSEDVVHLSVVKDDPYDEVPDDTARPDDTGRPDDTVPKGDTVPPTPPAAPQAASDAQAGPDAEPDKGSPQPGGL